MTKVDWKPSAVSTARTTQPLAAFATVLLSWGAIAQVADRPVYFQEMQRFLDEHKELALPRPGAAGWLPEATGRAVCPAAWLTEDPSRIRSLLVEQLSVWMLGRQYEFRIYRSPAPATTLCAILDGPEQRLLSVEEFTLFDDAWIATAMVARQQIEDADAK